MIKRINTILLSLFIVCNISAQNYTVIISLDGCRWDYPQIHNMPNIDRIATDGVSANMRPSYPSSTFPNHYTLITGLVPDHHGIINNTFWDVANGRQYSIGDSLTRNDTNYYNGETIWATAQKQNVKTASAYWVGSDMPINNNLPSEYLLWAKEPRLSFAERIDTALTWLDRSDENDIPRLITLYMEEPDGSGHWSGPRGADTKYQVHYLDSLIGVLRAGIERLPIKDKVNLIVTSDHGMTDISPDRFVNVADYLDSNMYQRIIGSNPSFVFTEDDKTDSVYNLLKDIEGISVYRKNDIPKEFNYGSNANISQLIVVPDWGWQFGFKPLPTKGAHGFPVENKDMHVLFRAVGPDFKVGYQSNSFDNTAIYPLLCYLLDVVSAPNDGDLEQVLPMLTK